MRLLDLLLSRGITAIKILDYNKYYLNRAKIDVKIDLEHCFMKLNRMKNWPIYDSFQAQFGKRFDFTQNQIAPRIGVPDLSSLYDLHTVFPHL